MINKEDYKHLIDLSNKDIKRVKKQIKWYYAITTIHILCFLANIYPFNIINSLVSILWLACVVFDIFMFKKFKIQINKYKDDQLDILKKYDHDQWVKTMRFKKLDRLNKVLE